MLLRMIPCAVAGLAMLGAAPDANAGVRVSASFGSCGPVVRYHDYRGRRPHYGHRYRGHYRHHGRHYYHRRPVTRYRVHRRHYRHRYSYDRPRYVYRGGYCH